ncbi:MAG: TIGR03619 family F420-dependent LLM class oxidoreductase [Acidimicrobiia bacterium]|nr:TIGR03619 family F420-dependent LLM class oxidoreductase [Acidimicrobiia bacterium]
MQLGVTFPQIEIGSDIGVVREYAQAAEELGFDYLLAYDHVLGAGRGTRPDWTGPYDSSSLFHEPFTLFSWLAAVAPGLSLVTGVIILPQRQTALVAKQAAQVDLLCGGRFRLGVGLGWNDVEYEALGEPFTNRGRRADEQIALLRQLWTTEHVTFEGRYHKVTDAGINPLPPQRPIPIWVGGLSDAAIERVGRLGDGWFPMGKPSERNGARIERFRQVAESEGRDPAAIGIDARVEFGTGGEADWQATAEAWRQLGATHVGVNTMNAGLKGAEHIDAIRRFREAMA